MLLQANIPAAIMDGCMAAALEAAEARNSDHAALVGCQARPESSFASEFKKQGDDFQGLADRLRERRRHITEDSDSLDESGKHELLSDLRHVLVAIRIAAFEVGLHGKDAGLSDSEIATELGKYARLDYQLRATIVPWLKSDLGITETKAY